MPIASFLIGRVLLPGIVPAEVLLYGAGMLLVVVLIHGAGLDYIVGRHRRRSESLLRLGWHPAAATMIFATTILLMLALHIIEACAWGVVLYKSGLVTDFRDSIYFSANTYTTIGYGKMVLPDNWRELSPIMAISGLFTFAWTTGEMFNVVGRHHEVVAALSEKRKEKKALKHKKQAAGE